jgi:hypothetical protein
MQDDFQSSDWRIQLIPYDDPRKRYAIRRPADFVAPLGLLGFVIFAVLAAKQAKAHGPQSIHNSKYLLIAFASLAVAFVGVLLRSRREHRGWEIVPAKCMDRELRRAYVSRGRTRGWHWYSRIVCEFDYNGARVRVTPNVYWSSFTSEEAAKRFLDQRISPDGDCKLHVNPKNPVQTELFGQGIKEKLVY